MYFTLRHRTFQATIGIAVFCSPIFATDTALSFVSITPCRVVDTRTNVGALGGPDLLAGTRDFPILAGSCGIPNTATAYSINVTAIPAAFLGYLTIYATGQDQPLTSTLNSDKGGVVANEVTVAAGTDGSVRVYASDQTNLILDVDGYFVPAPAGAQGPTGEQGASGATGTTGPAGPQGPAGATGSMGATGLTGATGPAGLAFQGNWSNAAAYALHDGTYYDGSSYISLIANNTANEPDISHSQWSLLAQQGAAGPVGATGTPGAAGSNGAVGAQGPAGPLGPTGTTGPAGLAFQGNWSNAATYALHDGTYYNGSSYISLIANNTANQPDISHSQWSLLAQQGAAGAVGAAGAAGLQGPPGINGSAGTNGTNGTNGANGTNGPMVFAASVNYASGAGGYAAISGLNQSGLVSQSSANLITGQSCSAATVTYKSTTALYELLVYQNGSYTFGCNGYGSSCSNTSSSPIAATDTLSYLIYATNGSSGQAFISLVCQP